MNTVEHYVYTAKSFVWGSFRVTSTNLSAGDRESWNAGMRNGSMKVAMRL